MDRPNLLLGNPRIGLLLHTSDDPKKFILSTVHPCKAPLSMAPGAFLFLEGEFCPRSSDSLKVRLRRQNGFQIPDLPSQVEEHTADKHDENGV